MNDGIFGFSLLIELFIAYFIVTTLYDKQPNKWWYAIAAVLLINLIVRLTAGEWFSIFSGNFDFFWNNWFK
jgi:hypothetical protein